MTLILYLAESALLLSFFYSLYVIFLTSETFFQLNRFYLLATVVLAIVIPGLRVDIELSQEMIAAPVD